LVEENAEDAPPSAVSSPERTGPRSSTEHTPQEKAEEKDAERKSRKGKETGDDGRRTATQRRSTEQHTADSSLNLRDELDGAFEAWAFEEVLRLQNCGGSGVLNGGTYKISEINSWKATKSCLESLGFNFEAPEARPWETLGILGGGDMVNENSSHLLRSRCDTLRAFSNKDAVASFNELDRVEASKFNKQIKGIEAAAHARLKTLRRDKAKQTGHGVPTWGEPSPDLAKHLDDIAERRSKLGYRMSCFLYLSDIQNDGTLSQLSHTAGVQATRTFYSNLFVEGKMKETLNALNGQEIVMWAPSNQDDISFMNRGLEEARKRNIKLTILFIVPFTALPCSWENALPFIRNPFRGKTWKTYITETQLMVGATRCVFSGSISPLHQLRNIAIYHATTVVDVTPGASSFVGSTYVEWKNEVAELEEQPYIVADFAASEGASVEYILTTTPIEGLIGWGPTNSSRGSTGSLRRLQMAGYFTKGTSTTHLRTAIKLLRSNEGLDHCLLGTKDLFDDNHALIVDCDDTRAMTAVTRLVDQCLLITPRQALIATTVPEGIWCTEITELARTSRLLAIKLIQHRDGQPFARPAELPHIARSRAAQEERGENPELATIDPYGTTTMTFEGNPAVISANDQTKVIERIATMTGLNIPLVPGDPYSPLPDNTTNSARFVTDHKGFWNGRVKFTFDSCPAHEMLREFLNGALLKIGKRTLTAWTEHSFLFPGSIPKTNRPGRKANVHAGPGEPLRTCAERTVKASATCTTLPCPVCDAPGGAKCTEAEGD